MSTKKETKEVLIALVALVKLLKKHIEDGLDVNDMSIVYELLGDPKYKMAIQGIDKVIDELKDLNLKDGIELIQSVLDELK